MATRIEEKHRQAFRFFEPAAKRVLLVGTFTDWEWNPKAMEKDRDGFWRATVELAPGRYRFRFIVDGEWRNDPECTTLVPNAYGGEDMVRVAA